MQGDEKLTQADATIVFGVAIAATQCRSARLSREGFMEIAGFAYDTVNLHSATKGESHDE